MSGKRHNAYIVKWRDSSITRSWRPIDDCVHDEVAVITSVGWAIRSTPRTVTLTTSISECGNAVDAISIPREAIIKMTKLKHYVEGG